MSIINRGEEEEEVVKLSAADIKKYEARFAQTVVKFSKLQLNECIGKGIIASCIGSIAIMYV